MKSIYLIQSLENGYYKIGVSKNPNRRLSTLQTGNSSKLKLVITYQTDLAYKIEKSLHNKFSHTNKIGEWFDLSVVEALTFVESCKKIEENFIFLKENGNVFI